MTPERRAEVDRLVAGDALAVQPGGSAYGRALREALVELDAAENRIAELSLSFRKYASHQRGCGIYTANLSCTCGFSEVKP